MFARPKLNRRNLNMKPHLIFVGSILFSSLATLEARAAATDIDSNYKYAWSKNVGWIDFQPQHGGVKVCPDHLEGFAWGKNIGWIKLGSHESPTDNCDEHTYQDGTGGYDWGVNRHDDNTLSGFAWNKNVGWINFAPQCETCPPQITIDPKTGEFNGYVWSKNIGWIHLGKSYRVRLNTQIGRVLVPQTGGTGPGESWPNPRFTDNGNGTVTDNLTGIIWLKNANCNGKKSWENAKNMPLEDNCLPNDSLTKEQWRLPTLRELQSLVHYGQIGPALPNTDGTGQWIEKQPFIGVVSNKYWSSTEYVKEDDEGQKKKAWYVNFSLGTISTAVKTSPYHIWPVHDNPSRNTQ
jgi:hypothetical protein